MKNYTKKQTKDQSGQTLVEFILLLGSITIISLTFMSVINSKVANRWEKLANVLLEDPKQKLNIR